MRHQFIEDHRDAYLITLMCRILAVARSGYYEWRKQPLSARKIADLWRIVGWAMSASLHRQLVIDALQMALTTRQPPPGLLHHFDRGSRYTSDDYQALLTKHRIEGLKMLEGLGLNTFHPGRKI